MTGDVPGYELAAEDDESEFARLRRQTWSAAAPYLVGALVCWALGGYTDYRLVSGFEDQGSSPVVRQAILQTLAQVLLFAGLALFVIGLLVAVLRQHERWRRDLDVALDDAPADEVNLAQRHDRPVDVAPVLEWDTAPDDPDQLSR